MTSIIPMVDLTELDGVGPARSESLEEAGYATVSEVAEAQPEQLAEDAGVTEDKALDFIVQSQNIVAEEDAEVEESQPVTEEVAEAVEESEQDSEEDGPEPEETITVEEGEDESEEADSPSASENEPVDEGPDEIEFSLSFDAELEYDTFFDAVMGQRATMLRSNRDGVDAFDHALDQMRDGGMDEDIELSMEEQQLNDLHNCVRQTMIGYKGDNLIDHMDALKEVLNDINEVRDEHLF